MHARSYTSSGRSELKQWSLYIIHINVQSDERKKIDHQDERKKMIQAGRRSDPYVSACHEYMLQSAEERGTRGYHIDGDTAVLQHSQVQVGAEIAQSWMLLACSTSSRREIEVDGWNPIPMHVDRPDLGWSAPPMHALCCCCCCSEVYGRHAVDRCMHIYA